MKKISTFSLIGLVAFTSCIRQHHKKTSSKGSVSEMKLVVTPDTMILATGWYQVTDSASGVQKRLDRYSYGYYIARSPAIGIDGFEGFEYFEDSYGDLKDKGIKLTMNEAGTRALSDLTKNSIGHKIALIVDNRLLCTAKVMNQIKMGDVSISLKDYTRQSIENILNAAKKELHRVKKQQRSAYGI